MHSLQIEKELMSTEQRLWHFQVISSLCIEINDDISVVLKAVTGRP